jgi:hypothetical protein
MPELMRTFPGQFLRVSSGSVFLADMNGASHRILVNNMRKLLPRYVDKSALADGVRCFHRSAATG